MSQEKTKQEKSPVQLVVIGILIFGILSIAAFFLIKKNQYELISPKRGEIIEAVYGLGKVKVDKKYEVKVGIISSVEKLFVKEGDRVHKGAKLIKFKDTGIFRAPIDGTVTLINHLVAETVLPQSTVMRMENLKQRYIEVSLEQQGALRVKRDQSAVVIFEDLRGEKHEGKVSAIFPREDEFLVHVKVDGLKENVLPGMTADVSIEVGRHENALMIPVAAINRSKVIVKRDGKKKKLDIKVGGVDGPWAEVLSKNIQEDDQILVKRKK